MKVSRILILALLGTMIAAGCAPARSVGTESTPGNSPAPTSKKQIVLVARGEPYTLNRTISGNQPGAIAGIAELTYLLNTRLGDVQDFQKVVGTRLAEVAPTTDNGLWKVFPDGRMETTWKLRHDATWHDGAPFTADDMLFAIQAGRDKEVALLRNAGYDSVVSAEAPDPFTLMVTWSRPFILADAFIGDTEPLPRHLLDKAFNEDKAGFAEHPYFTRDFIGTGPYRLTDWALNSHMMLQAFDAYPLGRPRIDEIQWKFILDPNVMIANVLAGAATATIGRGISLQQSLQARDHWGDRGRVDFFSLGWVALFPQFINPNPPAIANVQFRRALLHALDRQELADVILAGTVPVVHNYVNPSQPEFQDTLPAAVRQEYDPRKAAQILEELGYTKRPDGFYYDRTGELLWAEIRTTAEDDLKDSLMFATADQWKGFGVDARPMHIPRQQAQDLEYRVTRPAFEMTRQPDDFSENSLKRLVGRESALPENGYRGQNRMRYMNADLDALIDRYLITIPFAERMEIGRGIVRHVTDNLPVMGVAYDSQAVLIGNQLVGMNAVQVTRNAHQWELR